MLRVLIPVDGSEHSLRAVSHAATLKDSLREKLEVLLLNVQRPIPVSALLLDGRLSTVHRLEEPLREHGAGQLSLARAALAAAGIEFHAHVEIGEPAPVIAAFAGNPSLRDDHHGDARPGRHRRALPRLGRAQGRAPRAGAGACRALTAAPARARREESSQNRYSFPRPFLARYIARSARLSSVPTLLPSRG